MAIHRHQVKVCCSVICRQFTSLSRSLLLVCLGCGCCCQFIDVKVLATLLYSNHWQMPCSTQWQWLLITRGVTESMKTKSLMDYHELQQHIMDHSLCSSYSLLLFYSPSAGSSSPCQQTSTPFECFGISGQQTFGKQLADASVDNTFNFKCIHIRADTALRRPMCESRGQGVTTLRAGGDTTNELDERD